MSPFTQIVNWLRRQAQARLQGRQYPVNEGLLTDFWEWLFDHPENWREIPGKSELRVAQIEHITLPESLESSNVGVYGLNFFDNGRVTLIRSSTAEMYSDHSDFFRTWLGLVPPLVLEATFVKYMEAHA